MAGYFITMLERILEQEEEEEEEEEDEEEEHYNEALPM